MGDDVESRRNFITTNARDVRNLTSDATAEARCD